jgi:small subunit ribosomal protein S1
VRTGRVTRRAEFGAFVELEPGVEGLAHASTFAPTGHSKGWTTLVAAGMTAAFEILSIDLEKKRIGLALVEQDSAQAAGPVPQQSELMPERADVAPPEGFGSLADKLRALKPREK